MNYQDLRNEILNDPLGLGYAAEVAAGRDSAVADLLNEKNTTRVVETILNARGLFARLGAAMGASVLEKLDAVRAQNLAVKWMFTFITTDGIDLGHPETRAQVDALAQAQVFTAAEAEAIKALAVVPASRAKVLFGREVDSTDISKALRG